jgi:hypothetical protein
MYGSATAINRPGIVSRKPNEKSRPSCRYASDTEACGNRSLRATVSVGFFGGAVLGS